MPAILIKDVPPALHRRLKQQAASRRRSLQQEVMVTLTRGLETHEPPPRHPLPPPVPVKTKFPLTEEWLRTAKNEGRP